MYTWKRDAVTGAVKTALAKPPTERLYVTSEPAALTVAPSESM